MPSRNPPKKITDWLREQDRNLGLVWQDHPVPGWFFTYRGEAEVRFLHPDHSPVYELHLSEIQRFVRERNAMRDRRDKYAALDSAKAAEARETQEAWNETKKEAVSRARTVINGPKAFVGAA